MSTRATIAIGDGWHLYREQLDGTNHLEITEPARVSFEASEDFIDVMIPDEILAAIQALPSIVEVNVRVVRCLDCLHHFKGKVGERCLRGIPMHPYAGECNKFMSREDNG